MPSRRKLLLASLAAIVATPRPLRALGRLGEVRFALTAVVMQENLTAFERFGTYLSAQIGRPVEFVRRRNYGAVMALLEQGELDFAWICGYPYVKPRSAEMLDLLVAPVYQGAPLYRSLIIVPTDSPAQHVEDLAGSVFAYSDPESNSGYMVPRALLRTLGHDPDRFFRFTFFTFSHAETIHAVAARFADAGAVDSYVYDSLSRVEPALVARTRVLHRSPAYGFPPIVVHRAVPAAVRERVRQALVGMSKDTEGREVLGALGLDGFTEVAPGLYDSIREVAALAQKAPPGDGGKR